MSKVTRVLIALAAVDAVLLASRALPVFTSLLTNVLVLIAFFAIARRALILDQRLGFEGAGSLGHGTESDGAVDIGGWSRARSSGLVTISRMASLTA